MIDVIYVAGTVAFFALMLLYVKACERLGSSATAEINASEDSKS